MAINIVGLGPGDGRLITRAAWEILAASRKVYVRTERHPAIDDLPESCKILSFDDVYENAKDFDDVYDTITDEIIREARKAKNNSEPIVYAVPGDPSIGEATVSAILKKAKEAGVQVEIFPGVSFLEPTLAATGVDGLDGLQLFDAIELTHRHYPPINSDLPLLLGQLYDRFVAGDVKLALSALYPDDHEVALIHAAGTVDQTIERIPLYSIDRSQQLAHLSSLFVPPLPNVSSLPALAETVAYLRSPDGCPWDQEQTRQSMRATLLEEATEVLEALDADDSLALCEELGDMLYHLVMQAQIAREQEDFRLVDVIAGIDAKLKKRHPHVWGDMTVVDSDEVINNWELLKENERQIPGRKLSQLDHLPALLPSLAKAQKIQDRVSRVGFDWSERSQVLDKVLEEIDEIKQASTLSDLEDEVGDLLFAVVNWSRWLGIDAESAMRGANRRFEHRFRKLEDIASEREIDLADLEINLLEEMWQEAKNRLGVSKII